MNASNFKLGTDVLAIGFYGENGAKTHCAFGKIEADDKGEKALATFAAYACDGDGMHQGNGGLYRATGSILCASEATDRAAILDAAITCDNCRRNMGLPEVAKSAAALATLESKKAQEKAVKEAAKTAARITELETRIASCIRNIETATAYNATPDAELIAARIANFCAGGSYSPELIAAMNANPDEAKSVSEKKIRNAHWIKTETANIKKMEKTLAGLRG